MARRVADTDEFKGARFERADLSGATFRDVDLSGVKVVDGLLLDAELGGLISGLRVNGVEVAPLVIAELDRRFPERVALRTTDAGGLQAAWATVDRFWRPTIELARTLPDDVRQQRVDGEWSLVETLRHLIFVTDAWFGHAALGKDHPYHPLGLAPTFLGDGRQFGLDPAARPSFDAVMAVRIHKAAEVGAFLASVDAAALQQPRRGGNAYPPESEDTVVACLHVVMDEEWNHHQYARRDLGALTHQ